ncbi:hypothetical protein [Sessilibacter corallicola]|uniref:Uncharacterized protein n=1 Tax=Sessilibacter corallicola TaxID=2904075 RepID=A0ABQ0A700_9GAMM
MSKYGHERLFLNENGENEEFSLHFDSTGSRRVCFKELPEKKAFFIARIGPHLTIQTG